MKDGLGREIDYLRISLTDKCNLRCGYCMPSDGIQHMDHSEVLSLEEMGRLVRIMTGLGIKRVRLTGGEPLVRRGVTDFIRMLKSEYGIGNISMTSNGIMLAEKYTGRYGGMDDIQSECSVAEGLKRAGLSDINISLDTLDPETCLRLTGLNGVDAVKKGIDAAVLAGLDVKLNCVPVKNINDREITELMDFAGERGLTVRFIELMPIGCGMRYKGVPTAELIAMIEMKYGKASRMEADPSEIKGPAVYYSFEGYRGRAGFISPLSHSFCEECCRVRLTCAGYLKLCLQYPDGADLKTPMRRGATDSELEDMIRSAIMKKPAAHSFGRMDADYDKRKMVEIGG